MGACGIALTEQLFSDTADSELLDGRFRLQQDRNAIANGIYALALVALQAVFTAKDQGLSANRAGKNLEELGRNHGFIVA
jgi:hypothetical protein